MIMSIKYMIKKIKKNICLHLCKEKVIGLK